MTPEAIAALVVVGVPVLFLLVGALDYRRICRRENVRGRR